MDTTPLILFLNICLYISVEKLKKSMKLHLKKSTSSKKCFLTAIQYGPITPIVCKLLLIINNELTEIMEWLWRNHLGYLSE